MAKGSHSTWGDYDNRTCCICNQPIRITRQGAFIYHDDRTGEHRSTHTECGSPLTRAQDPLVLSS